MVITNRNMLREMSIPTQDQKQLLGPVYYTQHNARCRIYAATRFDDHVGTGYNTFGIRGRIEWKTKAHHGKADTPEWR
jgi:hypothetical protein